MSWSFTRNPASQILTETQSNDAYSWNAFATVDRDYQTNGLNQYTTAGSASFTYDANGNLTSDGAKTYLYDVENRLVRVTEGAYTTDLFYDPMGRLARTSSNAPGYGTIRYLHDGDALVAEYNASGTMLQRHVHGPAAGVDDPLVTYSGTGNAVTSARFLYADPRGSIVYIASSANGSPGLCQSKCTCWRKGHNRLGAGHATPEEASQSVPLFQLVTGDHPPGGDDVRAVPTEPAERRGPAGRARDRHLPRDREALVEQVRPAVRCRCSQTAGQLHEGFRQWRWHLDEAT